MKNIIEFSVRYPITISMAVLAVMLIGYISFSNLGMDLFPDLNNPRIFIELKAGERPPEEMEKQFVENIEAIAIRQKKVIEVSSISETGTARITVEYSWDADMDEAFLDLQKSLTIFSQNSDLEELNITQHDPNSSPVVVIGLSHPDINDMDELRRVAENYLHNELIRLEGIAAVEIIGAEEKEVRIETSDYLLEAHDLDLSTLASRIQASNVSISGGSIVELGVKYVIKGQGQFKSIDDIKNVIVGRQAVADEENETKPVFLKDLAEISFKNKEPENMVRIDGKRSIALAIYKETRYNTIKAVNELEDNLEQLKRALPSYDFIILQNQATFIDNAIDEVEETALIGVLLAILILYLFLRRFEITAIISIAIPISVVSTFNLMYFNDLTINIMTLGGLALGAGMLVDNAIVVMENIFRNIETGLSSREAAIKGTAQVAGAITASTLTTVVVFLPIVYLHGAAGELFKDQAWTVAFSLISSLFVAITVIPMLSHRLIKTKTIQKKHSYQFRWYPQLLEKIIDRRWWVVTTAFGLIIFTVLILPWVGSEFMPQGDANDFQLEVKLEEGTTLKHMDQVATQIEGIIREKIGDYIDRIFTRIGPVPDYTGAISETEKQKANIAVLTLYRKAEAPVATDDLISALNSAFAYYAEWELNFIKEQSSLKTILGTDQAPVVIEIKGEELTIIRELTMAVKQQIDSLENLYNVVSSFDEDRPEVNVIFDRIRAGSFEVDFAAVGSQLEEILEGKSASEWDHDGEMRDITIKQPDISLNQLSDLYINTAGTKIRLDEIAWIQEGSGEKQIEHKNQSRVGKIYAELSKGMALDKATSALEKEIQKINFPQNYFWEITGEELKRQESFSSLKFALLLSIILIYMVMASQFESLIHPFTILLTIPLAAVGAILIFFVLQLPLNVMAYIGIIMLVGIAVNDSIILVDAINQLKRQGMEIKVAIIEAGKRRIRPIIMTSLTTILALFPLTIGFGESAALRSPMALAVIGGLVTSTLLTLAVIPCVYYIMDQLGNRLRISN
jgi:HAE1 family hydrophobic/amphiphilic exporter-1